jgi:hypothetical protein
LRNKAFKQGVLLLRKYNEERSRREFRIAPFVLQTFLSGAEYILDEIEKELSQTQKEDFNRGSNAQKSDR